MFFDRNQYYKYIGTLEKIVNFSYCIIIGLCMLIGSATGKGTGFIIGTLTGLLLATLYTLKTKIQIQEMKWKMDIHEKIYKL